ncbi:uncharacterized protein LOC111620239 [Centruroides sculpturatus]|uniref:uncharacterized protein LOC111620239 n=1 Tax=Centruroides sculpturatus TaxID=218467 RepID=UPI000C6E1242|nr:uncharacterized protein LOC111620239 [Centruroides sculpturatus]
MQSQQQGKEQNFLKTSFNKTLSAPGNTNNENKDDEQCKADHKDDNPRLSVIVFQCHLCSFSTRSNEKWLEHKRCHIEDIPCTSTESEKRENGEAQAARVGGSKRKKCESSQGRRAQSMPLTGTSW